MKADTVDSMEQRTATYHGELSHTNKTVWTTQTTASGASAVNLVLNGHLWKDTNWAGIVGVQCGPLS